MDVVAELINDPGLTVFQRACLMDIHALVQERGGAACEMAQHDHAGAQTRVVEIRIPDCEVEIWVFGESARFRKGALDVRPEIWDFPSLHQMKKYFIEELARQL